MILACCQFAIHQPLLHRTDLITFSIDRPILEKFISNVK